MTPMSSITSREIILKKIRQALSTKTPQRFPQVDLEKPVYVSAGESREEQFAIAFRKVGGEFIFCDSELDFLDNIITLAQTYGWKNFYCREKALTDLMDDADFPYTVEEKEYPEGMVSITTCEVLVARLGSVLVSSKQGSGRRLFVAPAVHIVLAYTSQVYDDLKDALKAIRKKYGDETPSLIAALTGPSRTADIEKTLVTPAHGPQFIFVFLIDR
jgi:L-lactate dehydrogenase complex protein LldG